MLDVRRYSPSETLEFYEPIKQASPREQSSFSLGPQPTFRLLGPVKSSPKMPHPDSGERPSDASLPLLDSFAAAATETNPCRESRLLWTRSRLNGAKNTDTDIW